MLSRGNRVRLVLDSYGVPEGTQGEVIGTYRRGGAHTYIVQFPTEEQVLPAENVELVEVATYPPGSRLVR
jgi:hypothetical protein